LGTSKKKNPSLPAEPVTKNAAVRLCGITHPLEDGDNDQRIIASSPPPFVDPGQPSPCQRPNANSNLISSPHNSNHDCMEMADHTRRAHQEAAEAATYGIKNKAAAGSSSDMRTVLLQRLEDEQRVARRDASTLDCSASPTQDTVATLPDGKEAEARLRTRALLRVRLAAIKKAPQMNA